MLSGLGKPPERDSRWVVGDDARGSNLDPGPGSCYLNGVDMRAITGAMYLRSVGGVVIAYRGAMWFVVRRALLW
jgi:hypothetical protein